MYSFLTDSGVWYVWGSYFALWGLLYLPCRKIIRWTGLKVHVWKYRNPANRVCIHCGRRENEFCGLWDRKDNWWEVMNYPERPDACWGNRRLKNV